jgi:hypothetical protein
MTSSAFQRKSAAGGPWGVVVAVGLAGGNLGLRVADQPAHEAAGPVHGGERLDRPLDVHVAAPARARDELRGLPHQRVEVFDLVAAELVDARAADAALRAGEDLDHAAVAQGQPAPRRRAGEVAAERRAFEEGGEVGVHLAGLFERATEHADLHARLEEQVQRGGHRAQKGLAAAAVGPDHGVAAGRGL